MRTPQLTYLPGYSYAPKNAIDYTVLLTDQVSSYKIHKTTPTNTNLNCGNYLLHAHNTEHGKNRWTQHTVHVMDGQIITQLTQKHFSDFLCPPINGLILYLRPVTYRPLDSTCPMKYFINVWTSIHRLPLKKYIRTYPVVVGNLRSLQPNKPIGNPPTNEYTIQPKKYSGFFLPTTKFRIGNLNNQWIVALVNFRYKLMFTFPNCLE